MTKENWTMACAIVLIVLAISLVYFGVNCNPREVSKDKIIDCETMQFNDASIHFMKAGIRSSSLNGWEQVKQFCEDKNETKNK